MKLTGLARKLVDDGLVDETTVQNAVSEATKNKIPLVTYLVKNELLSGRALACSASEEFGLPLLDLDAIDIQVIPANLVNEKLIRQHNALPLFKRGNRIFVALSDPTNLQALDEIKFHSGVSTEAVLVEEDKLSRTIDQSLQQQESASFSDLADTDLDELNISAGDDLEEGENSDFDADDAPIVRYVHKILLDAINTEVSDVHFEPYETQFRIRFRRDGILEEIATPPVTLASRIAARLKVMSRLDISERRSPQDGRFKLKLSKHRSIDFRVSTCPTLYGEKVVLRILDSTVAKLNINNLGFSQQQLALYLKAIKHPQGAILVTGPTGSGKTVSLYSALNILNTKERNISTAEDPVEINLPGINQVNMNPKAGLTFSSALRCFLRQDPDVIMVGEIRDLETAEIAVKAAQTGHLVLSTLHTNSAPETITRLNNMGIPSYNIATSVSLIIAQRLARCLCDHCKEPDAIPKSALLEQGFTQEEIDHGLVCYKAVGCSHCNHGYKGRIGIYEVMYMTPSIGHIIMENGNAMDLANQAKKEGMHDLRQSGLAKIVEGVASLEEINRVTKD